MDVTSIIDSFDSRIDKAFTHFQQNVFSRKDYMKLHKTISTASASRDLKKAVQLQLILKEGVFTRLETK